MNKRGDAVFHRDRFYHVEFEDCCVAGSFSSRVFAIYAYEGEPGSRNLAHSDLVGPEECEVVFDNGVALTRLFGVRAIELTTELP
jgi:hypothetical protein